MANASEEVPLVHHEQWEVWIAGVSMIVPTSLLMVLYVICLYIFKMDKEFSKLVRFLAKIYQQISQKFVSRISAIKFGVWTMFLDCFLTGAQISA